MKQPGTLRIADTAAAAPAAVVRYYVFGPTLSDGSLVAPVEMYEVAAHAALANIVVKDVEASGFLTIDSTQSYVSFGMLEAQGLLASADAIADKLSPEVCAEIVEGIQIGSQRTAPLPRVRTAFPSTNAGRRF